MGAKPRTHRPCLEDVYNTDLHSHPRLSTDRRSPEADRTVIGLHCSEELSQAQQTAIRNPLFDRWREDLRRQLL